MKEDAPRVIKIPAKPETTRQAEARRQLRVAAYCRVSTKEEDQANSYEVQKEYYTDKIMSNTAWTLAEIDSLSDWAKAPERVIRSSLSSSRELMFSFSKMTAIPSCLSARI